MADRKRKRDDEPVSKRKKEEREGLADTILENSILVMKSCTYCEKQGCDCIASEEDSRRCLSCMRKVATHYSKLNKELEEAEEAWLEAGARVKRLRTQKREWLKRMERAIARGIDNLEELERIEREEREEREAQRAEAARQAATSLPNPTDPVTAGSAVDAVDWDAFDPSLLDLDFGGSHSQGLSSVQGPQ
ncbi:hypothetical protein M431DRAFT_8293 [Trichoderma harzianum CBS 226.95]|uniref:Uncharacterized protein n=1 Tax=Trichoderma harzianum CBS 226.95 TaxID=983964 RepID=A0A2T4A1S7_TRIHA|nr:hypothetical protein M431DRAFT_8293 [Trichoderma harzianum CBS 226.95]PTB51014.1 hypothetical protein M431DRAFT_8293 [Trichoderma harzianum CBS 226.95]